MVINNLIVANWKMNGCMSLVQEFIHQLNNAKSNVVLCLPFPYLHIAANKNFSLGAQNCHTKSQGAYTGEISAAMLRDIGCKYVIVGHSERRLHFDESNEIVQEKAKIAVNNNLIPIVCIGEKARGDNIERLFEQCRDSICDGCIIAYEPVWAIGTGVTPEYQEIADITERLAQKFNAPVLYGGSINQNNAYNIVKIPSVSGLLVGGASLKVDIFSKIISDIT